MFCHLEVIIVKNFCLSAETSVTFFVVLESFARGKWIGEFVDDVLEEILVLCSELSLC
jgi:hypothetical protein